MLPDILNTNEVKNAAGVEVEFARRLTEGSTTEFKQVAETPNLPHRVALKHSETGKGVKLVRRSVQQVVYTSIGVDGNPCSTVCNISMLIPVGNLSSDAAPKACLAEAGSLCFTLGTNTFLYDGTGNGAKALLNGDL